MRENKTYARHKRRYKVTTDSKHGVPVEKSARKKLCPDGAESSAGDVGHHLPVGG